MHLYIVNLTSVVQRFWNGEQFEKAREAVFHPVFLHGVEC
jgi:hypothetical protein